MALKSIDEADGLARYTVWLESTLAVTMTLLEILLLMAAFVTAARLTDSILLDVASIVSAFPLGIFIGLHSRHIFKWNPKPRKGWHVVVMLVAYLTASIGLPFLALQTVDGIVATQMKTGE